MNNDAVIVPEAGQRKARGAFFTPPEMTRFLADWAVRTAADVVLEPSCGEAAFLLAAGDRLAGLGTPRTALPHHLHGIEIHGPSASRGHSDLRAGNLDASIRIADFFDCPAEPRFDAVVGNPPYIRYQLFTGEARQKSLEAASAAGVRLTGLASSWAAFVIHASEFLKPAGRLGLVLPAELLTVSYAAPVRRFLLDRFSRIRLIMFDGQVFPEVLEEVVLLLAEGSGGTPSFDVFQVRDLAELVELAALPAGPRPGFDLGKSDKWTPALLPQASFEGYQNLCQRQEFTSLLDWGETYLGAVTGNNNYFTLTLADIAARGLETTDLLEITPPGSRHLAGLAFSTAAWQRLCETGRRCFLFFPQSADLGTAARNYVTAGETAKVHHAYKCRVRKPWWRVPLPARPDLFLTYMNHDHPRLLTNEAGVQVLNSLYGVSLRPAHRLLGRNLLPLAALNSVTLLGAEMVGRAYGGGLLKLEPKEADRWPMPAPATVAALAQGLNTVRPDVTAALDGGDLERAVSLVDEVLLVRHMNISGPALSAVRRARAFLFRRRVGRARPNGRRLTDLNAACADEV